MLTLSPAQLLLAASSLAFLLLLALRLLLPRTTSKLPPSPPGLPILGNALQVPPKLLFLKLSEWAAQLGDIYSLNVAGQRVVVLSGAKVAAEVLDKRSGVTSSRPRFVMSNEIMARDLLLPGMPHGDRWRRLRRVTHEGFNIRACESYYPVQESEAAQLILSLLSSYTSSPSLKQELTNLAGNTIWRTLYSSGPRMTEKDGAKVQRVAMIAQSVLDAATPMAYLVDSLPFLKGTPKWMARWKAYGEEFFRDTDGFFTSLFDEDKKRQQKGEHDHPGFMTLSADSFQRFETTDQEVAWMGGGLFAAGAETTVASLHHFIQAMILYPQVAKTAQKHVDALIGSRPPTVRDRDQLPYMQAMVKEILRWRPALPLGLPHTVTEDFEYNEYVIPKGTTIFSNIWAVAHDPTIFPDHEDFRPERFLKPDGSSFTDPIPNYHDDQIAYGYGRRVCPGRDFANNSLFINMTYLLWAFDIGAAKDESGKEIVPDRMAFDDHWSIHPAPFKYQLRPRRSDLKELLAPL